MKLLDVGSGGLLMWESSIGGANLGQISVKKFVSLIHFVRMLAPLKVPSKYFVISPDLVAVLGSRYMGRLH